MSLEELNRLLTQNENKALHLMLPDSGQPPVAFHVTDAGTLSRSLMDCAGHFHRAQACLLQAVQGTEEEHRLAAHKLRCTLQRAAPVALPTEANHYDVEIEYEQGTVSHYPVERCTVEPEALIFHLRRRPMHYRSPRAETAPPPPRQSSLPNCC